MKALLLLLLLAACAIPATDTRRWLMVENKSSYGARLYYVQAATGTWRPLYREPIYAGQRVRVRVPERALDGGRMVRIAVRFTDGLLMKSRREEEAARFTVPTCAMVEVAIRYPAPLTSPTGREWPVCEG